MRNIPATVVVVTARDPGGDARGVTVSSLTSVSLRPPVVSFGVMRGGRMHGILTASQSFCVNVLRHDQAHMAAAFADPTGPTQLSSVSHRRTSDGVPILDGVLGAYRCSVLSSQAVGDHNLWLGEVKEIVHDECEDASALVYLRQEYGTVVRPTLELVRAAWMALRISPDAKAALDALRSAHADDAAYSETRTAFAVAAVRDALRTHNPPSFGEFLARFPALKRPDYIHRFYSSERLRSPDGLVKALPPDRQGFEPV